jgi:hypothetical protein
MPGCGAPEGDTGENPLFARLCGVLRLIGKPLEWMLIGAVRLYQLCISPLLPRTCRFYPSCSRYMIDALRKNGPVIGLLQGLWRIMRCNPFCRGGYDPVKRWDGPEEESRNGK